MFYFSTERPITPGALPNHLKPLSVENFPEKTYCPEIEGEAWGKVEFESPLSGYEAMLSELVPQGSKHYFGIKYAYYARENMHHFITKEDGSPLIREMSAYGIDKPSTRIEIRTKPEAKIFQDAWFDTKEERDQFIEYLKQEVASYEDQH